MAWRVCPAKLLQLYPLEMYGRAVDEMQGFGMDQLTLHKVFVLATYLKSKYESEMFVQLDLLHKEIIKKDPKSANVLRKQQKHQTYLIK